MLLPSMEKYPVDFYQGVIFAAQIWVVFAAQTVAPL